MKSFRRVTCIVLSAAVLLAAMSITVLAAEPGDFVVEDGVRTADNGTNTAINIPPDLRIAKIDNFLFSGNKTITSVIIPEGVTVIDGAFLQCTGLTSITVPSSVISCSGLANGTDDLTIYGAAGSKDFFEESRLTDAHGAARRIFPPAKQISYLAGRILKPGCGCTIMRY